MAPEASSSTDMTTSSDVSIILTIGLPACGKSTLVRALAERLCIHEECAQVEVLDFDHMEQAIGSAFDPEVWKLARTAIKNKTESMLSDLVALELPVEEKKRKSVLILDDNFYLRSMRKVYYQLARTHEVNIKYLVVKEDADVCKLGNAKREGRARVPDFAIEHMAEAIEYPATAGWEANVKLQTFYGPPSCNDSLVDFVVREASIPPVLEESTGAQEEPSAAQDLELRFRKLVSSVILKKHH